MILIHRPTDQPYRRSVFPKGERGRRSRKKRVRKRAEVVAVKREGGAGGSCQFEAVV